MTDPIIEGIGSRPEVYEAMFNGKVTVTKTIYGLDENREFKPINTVVTAEYEFPPIGSRWLNNRSQQVYTVVGMVANADDGRQSWEVLYRCDSDLTSLHWRRSLESWYGTNREGQPRFVMIELPQ